MSKAVSTRLLASSCTITSNGNIFSHRPFTSLPHTSPSASLPFPVPPSNVIKQEFQYLNQTCGLKRCGYEELSCRYPTALSQDNMLKNRYHDVLPEEMTRVKLMAEKKSDSDYINANYIVANDSESSQYISCQAPLPSTFATFWRMIWEHAVPVICMLTRLVEGSKKKADIYWPEKVSASEYYGDFKVTLKHRYEKGSYIDVRIFELSYQSQTREVVQIHYTEWPDFGVPDSTHTIRELIKLMSLYRDAGQDRGLAGPVVAHCSAGIGRAGAFFAVVMCMHQLDSASAGAGAGAKQAQINVLETVRQMRQCRAGMVQTDQQYEFIYKVLHDYAIEKAALSQSLAHLSGESHAPRSPRHQQFESYTDSNNNFVSSSSSSSPSSASPASPLTSTPMSLTASAPSSFSSSPSPTRGGLSLSSPYTTSSATSPSAPSASMKKQQHMSFSGTGIHNMHNTHWRSASQDDLTLSVKRRCASSPPEFDPVPMPMPMHASLSSSSAGLPRNQSFPSLT